MKIHKNVTLSEEWVHLPQMNQAPSHNTMEPPEPPARPPLPKSTGEEESAMTTQEEEQSGYDQGFQKGVQQAHIAMEKGINTLNTLIQGLSNAIKEAQDHVKDEIADIVLMITQQFFIERQQNPQSIAQLVTNTLTQIHDKQNIRLALHPEDLARIQQGEIRMDLTHCKNIKIIPDERLMLGGCIIQNDHGVFNASIERQIDNLKAMLLEMRHASIP